MTKISITIDGREAELETDEVFTGTHSILAIINALSRALLGVDDGRA